MKTLLWCLIWKGFLGLIIARDVTYQPLYGSFVYLAVLTEIRTNRCQNVGFAHFSLEQLQYQHTNSRFSFKTMTQNIFAVKFYSQFVINAQLLSYSLRPIGNLQLQVIVGQRLGTRVTYIPPPLIVLRFLVRDDQDVNVYIYIHTYIYYNQNNRNIFKIIIDLKF